MGIVAKYKYNGSIYPDLIPEFNAEFTDYTITDEGNIIRDIEWEIGDIDTASGNPRDNITDHRRSDFIEILPNVSYMSAKPTHVGWYDSDKNYIGYNMWVSEYANTGLSASPSNARYAKFWHGEIYNDGFAVATGEITRTIESDSLPTQMRFGTTEGEVGTSRELSLLEVLEMNTSELLSMYRMFGLCENLTSITCDWNTSKVTNMFDAFCRCYKLSNIDVRYLDISNSLNNQGMFYVCRLIKHLDLSNWNKNSNNIAFSMMLANCINLISLDISNFHLSSNDNVTYLFNNSSSLKYIKCNMPPTIQILSSQLPDRTSDNKGVIIYQGEETLPSEIISTLSSKNWTVISEVELIAEYKYDSTIYKNLIPEFNDGYMGFITDEDIDENGIVTRKIEHVELPLRMRFGQIWIDSTTDSLNANRCKSLLEILDMNVSKITNAVAMFRICSNVTKINCDWSNLQTTDLGGMFQHNYYLESLNLESLNTVQATDISNMFYDCIRLSLLDISNFNLNKVTQDISAFARTTSLKDIGMIYCNKETINKVASLLPTDVHRTIWVGEHDLSQYDQYDHITYKTQIVEEEVVLNSPLLEGDRIEVVDGKLCHYHKMGMVVLDGSEDFRVIDDNFDNVKWFGFVIEGKSNSARGVTKSDKFPYSIQWGDLELIQDATTDSVWECNTFIAINKSKLSTLDTDGFKQWLQSNPTTVVYQLANPYYEVLQDKPLSLTLVSEEDNDISNSSNIPTNMIVDNRPLPTIGIDGSKEYTIAFDKSDEESSVIVNLCGSSIETTDNIVHITTPSAIENNELTILGNGEEISNVRILEGNVVDKGIPKESFKGLKNSFEDGLLPTPIFTNREGGTVNSATMVIQSTDMLQNGKIYTLVMEVIENTLNSVMSWELTPTYGQSRLNIPEGKTGMFVGTVETPGTALSNTVWQTGKTENGTSVEKSGSAMIRNLIMLEGDWTHLTEEDFNRLGQYKVEYKVTGKNKFNGEYWNNLITINNASTPNGYYGYLIQLEPNTRYTISITPKNINEIGTHYSYITNRSANNVLWLSEKGQPLVNKSHIISTDSTGLLILRAASIDNFQDCKDLNLQIEEGSVATEYEPYKCYTKTFYLNSPLLEGDTIEDVNGVATHVHRKHMYTLDGNEVNKGFKEDWYLWEQRENTMSFAISTQEGVTPLPTEKNHDFKSNYYLLCDSFNVSLQVTDEEWMMTHSMLSANNRWWGININKSKLPTQDLNGFKQWLSENPVTVVYELAEPWYEPIGAYRKIVLDGSENWEYSDWNDSLTNCIRFDMNNVITDFLINNNKAIGRADKFKCVARSTLKSPVSGDTSADNEHICFAYVDSGADSRHVLAISILRSKLQSQNINGFKQWLQQNPVTVIYELAEPQYQGSILCDSYVNGHLDIDSAVPVEKVEFKDTWLPLKYGTPSSEYTIQFEADSNGFIDYTYLTGENNPSKSLEVKKGLNTFNLIWNNISESPQLRVHGIGFNASNIQVVATDEDIEFGYFEGLQSSFEDTPMEITDRSSIVENHCLTWGSGETYPYEKYYHTDYIPVQPCEKYETSCPVSVFLYDENKQFICYSDKLTGWKTGGEGGVRVTEWVIPLDKTNVKYMRLESQLTLSAIKDFKLFDHKQYQVECKVEGKNKFDGEIIQGAWNTDTEFVNASIYVCTKNRIKVKPNTNYMISGNLTLTSSVVFIGKNGEYLGLKNYHYTQYFTTPNNCEYIKVDWHRSTGVKPNEFTNLQIEEGTQATPYEPYKSYTKTFYLNSPLLQGDTIEEVNGKMCHVHRMGKVVLDGSSDEGWYFDRTFTSINHHSFFSRVDLCLPTKESSRGYCNTIPYIRAWSLGKTHLYIESQENANSGRVVMEVSANQVDSTKESICSWLQDNPATIVYELAEPWYEPIEPEQQNLTITSIKDADLHIDTAVPISSTVTYNVNVKLLTDFEESIISQVQNANEVNLLSILDEEIDN